MDGPEVDDATDYDKTFIEEPAILDKYKAAAEVCESKYHPNSTRCQHSKSAIKRVASRLTFFGIHFQKSTT